MYFRSGCLRRFAPTVTFFRGLISGARTQSHALENRELVKDWPTRRRLRRAIVKCSRTAPFGTGYSAVLGGAGLLSLDKRLAIQDALWFTPAQPMTFPRGNSKLGHLPGIVA